MHVCMLGVSKQVFLHVLCISRVDLVEERNTTMTVRGIQKMLGFAPQPNYPAEGACGTRP
ncbi:MAG: hypothetical protein HW390_3252 [Candidatus Brocadiaceae bacterium]|nr:hypothetical protein [Candidatus Brocadiaceae bacterium]